MKLETIVALATPPMKSALAIIRVSGDDCFEIVSKCFSKDLTKIDKRTLMVGSILDGDKEIDEVVLAIYKGPKNALCKVTVGRKENSGGSKARLQLD